MNKWDNNEKKLYPKGHDVVKYLRDSGQLKELLESLIN